MQWAASSNVPNTWIASKKPECNQILIYNKSIFEKRERQKCLVKAVKDNKNFQVDFDAPGNMYPGDDL